MKQLGITVLAAGAAAPLLLSLRGPSASTEGLLGATLEVVRSELGPPLSISASPEVMQLDYEDEAGELIPGAIVVVDGIVVSAAPHLVRSTAIGRDRSLLLAGPLELVDALGPSLRVSQGASSSTLHYSELSVEIVGGIVVSTQRN
jgi:hypothetical protein